MLRSLEDLNKVRALADSGQFAAVVDYLAERPHDDLEGSPTLALLYGTAQARLGRSDEGRRWVELALDRSRERADRAIEARALNVCGVIALFDGRIDDAAPALESALATAKRESDHATVGRCSNNLGIISNLRGDHAQAVGSYTMAVAAFQQAGLQRGLAETHHNLGITYLEEGDYQRALEEADRAVSQAYGTGDVALSAQTLAGRAEIRVHLGGAKLAQHEVERALMTHRDIGDAIGEAQDLRILAVALLASGDVDDAESLLRDVIERAHTLTQPLLAAMASRDLAHLMVTADRDGAAKEMAQTARALFSQIGAEAEVQKLDEAFSLSKIG